MTPKEVFLSHSSKNRASATGLADTLRNHGVPVWYSSINIRSAQQWHDEIGKALKRCDWFLLLITKASCKSKWVKQELSYALNHRQYNNHILPIKAEKCPYEALSWTLGNFQMVDFDVRNNRGFKEILATWGIGFDPDKKGDGKADRASKHTRRRRRAA
jgi:TIR domain-containing protein